jgi:hypothetical protein
MTHARPKLCEAHGNTKSALSHGALERIAAFYKIEDIGPVASAECNGLHGTLRGSVVNVGASNARRTGDRSCLRRRLCASRHSSRPHRAPRRTFGMRRCRPDVDVFVKAARPGITTSRVCRNGMLTRRVRHTRSHLSAKHDASTKLEAAQNARFREFRFHQLHYSLLP